MVPGSLAGLLAVATLALARTPAGFQPASNVDLIVEYNGVTPLNGVVVPRNTTISRPRIGTLVRLTGTSYAVLMIDLDIPTNTPPATNTLLHWMQTGLTPATTATRINTASGTLNVFLLENSTNTAPIQAYFGPNPPARTPLSHRYTQILVETSDVDPEDITVLRTAAATIVGFNASAVLTTADLEGKVVAGNSFNVTNPGPVNDTAAGGGGGTASTTSGSPTSSPTGGGFTTGTGSGANATPSSAGAIQGSGGLLFGAVAAGAIFLGL
ncbi:phosphatidylethanolamine-binding protein [Lasiosphaeris hirsuta]|uniref:Phosphatidylethanolamine-binding protein n=1 Tax=Lasiosphaeris hirsuta TaxID=260670 RepID=A0AA40ARA6_9PEZI|nr:phosphatidylethanolamine-binding protein [Lasiosphaeris hirsuta]